MNASLFFGRAIVLTVIAGIGCCASAAVIKYGYDAAGRLTGVDYGAGRARSYAYDNTGNLLRVTSAGGISLTVSLGQNNQLTLSWPASADGFVLESAGSLSAPIQWTPVTTTPQVVGDQKTVTVTATGTTTFYRLRKP